MIAVLQTRHVSQTHFWPYTELCRACLVSYDFIGNVETFDDDIQKIADRFPKNQVLQEMRNSKRLNCRSNCGANDFSSKYEGDYKQLKQETIVRLYEIYKNDFEFGGYDYPHTYIGSRIYPWLYLNARESVYQKHEREKETIL